VEWSLLRKPSNTIRVGKGRVLCNPKFDYVFLGHVRSIIFDFPTSIFITFTTKSYLRSETHIAYKFCTMYPKQLLFRRNFLFVRRKRHACFRSSFSSYQVIVYVCSSRNRFLMSYQLQNVLRFALKIKLKFEGSKVHKICYTSSNLV